jgi:exopolysaccharide production protein ExoY
VAPLRIDLTTLTDEPGVVATVAGPGQSFQAEQPVVLERTEWVGKYFVDVVFGLILLVLFMPVFLLVALAIKLSSNGPVLFRQRRVARGGEEFSILKFRTMQVDAEQRLRSDTELHSHFVGGGHKIPSHLDPRLTRIGRLLRKTSIDELPQLFNVVSGHMSLVGPRPVERSQLPDYQQYESVYLALRPGLTGLWQVSGRSSVPFPRRAEIDAEYLERCGPWLDAKILLRTPLAVLSGRGAD